MNDTDDFETNRSVKMPSFLPSIRLSSKNARKLLLEEGDLYANHNRSVFENSNRDEIMVCSSSNSKL
jgi:hypothetical protein